MGGPPCPHPDGAFFKDGPNHFLEFVQNPIKIRKIRVVPLRSGYPFFALNASIEPRSVHTCLLGLVGVPRAQRAAVAPYCAAWGRKLAGARVNFRVLRGFCGDVLNLARTRARRAKFSTHAL